MVFRVTENEMRYISYIPDPVVVQTRGSCNMIKLKEALCTRDVYAIGNSYYVVPALELGLYKLKKAPKDSWVVNVYPRNTIKLRF